MPRGESVATSLVVRLAQVGLILVASRTAFVITCVPAGFMIGGSLGVTQPVTYAKVMIGIACSIGGVAAISTAATLSKQILWPG